MSYAVDFQTVSTVGLESSPVAAALAGLRANEARYFKNKYDHVFTVEPARAAKDVVEWGHGTPEEERAGGRGVPGGGPRHPGGGAGDLHRLQAARGDHLRGGEHQDGLRVLRERPVD